MGKGRRSVKDGKRKRLGRSTVEITNGAGNKRKIPELKDIGIKLVELRGKSVTFRINPPENWTTKSIKFRVTTGQVLRRSVFDAAANALMKDLFNMSHRARKKAIPQIRRIWKLSDAPEWNEELQGAIDLIKVQEVMES